MLGNIRFSNQITNITNITRAFECHPGGEEHGKLLLGLAGAGIAANLSVATLIVARKALRRWSSGLLVHGTVVDGSRAALLVPLSLSVLRCEPVTRCSIIDTTFILLATVSSLNLLTASLSDAPLLPPPVLVPSLLKSAGFIKSSQTRQKQFISPLYPTKTPTSYYSDYYDEDANLLAETTAMPDSPQCVLFGSFMVWFAALVINLGPTFLSGAIAAQSEIIPPTPSCPLVRGPARHVILNVLWASVNLLCVFLAASHLRKLKRDLGRARIGLLAAAGAGLAGLAGITTGGSTSGLAAHISSNPNYSQQNYVNKPSSSGNYKAQSMNHAQAATSLQQDPSTFASRQFTPGELDVFLRQAQKSGQCHIRTLGTLAILNLVCWVPLYTCALLAPVGRAIWEDPISPVVYEVTLMLTFAHCILHPMALVILHQPLREEIKQCLVDTFCCVCICMGMEFGEGADELPPTPMHERDYDTVPFSSGGSGAGSRTGSRGGINESERELENLHMMTNLRSNRALSQTKLHSSTTETMLLGGSRSMDNLSANKIRRTPSIKSIKSNRSLGGLQGIPLGGTELLIRSLSPLHLDDDIELGLPPPPLPPMNSAFRKQHSMEDRSSSIENRW